MEYGVYSVLVIEGLVAVAATSLAWRWWRGRRVVGMLICGILLGMAWCFFLHGLLFGVFRVEGPRAERDVGTLVGFGLVTAVLPGIPLGAILGFALALASRMRVRRSPVPSKASPSHDVG